MSPENRLRVARMGGLSVSVNKQYMSEIGKRGGLKVSSDKAHMSAIGKIGGSRRGKKNPSS